MPCRNGVRAAHRHVEQPNRVHSVDLRFRRIACRADGDALDADARSACRHVDWSGHLCSCARSRRTGARHPAAALAASLHHSGGGEYPASGLTSGQSGAGDGWHGHPHGAREPSHCRTNRRERDKDEGYCSIGLGGTVRQAIAGWRQPRRSYPSASGDPSGSIRFPFVPSRSIACKPGGSGQTSAFAEVEGRWCDVSRLHSTRTEGARFSPSEMYSRTKVAFDAKF